MCLFNKQLIVFFGVLHDQANKLRMLKAIDCITSTFQTMNAECLHQHFITLVNTRGNTRITINANKFSIFYHIFKLFARSISGFPRFKCEIVSVRMYVFDISVFSSPLMFCCEHDVTTKSKTA